MKTASLAPYRGKAFNPSLSAKVMNELIWFMKYNPMELANIDEQFMEKYKAAHELGFMIETYKVGTHGNCYLLVKNGEAITQKCFNDILLEGFNPIVKTFTIEGYDVIATAVVRPLRAGDKQRKVYVHYNYMYLQTPIEEEVIVSQVYKNFMLKITEWCDKNNYTLYSY